MAYSRRSVAQAQQLYKIASDAAYTHRAAVRALQKIASESYDDMEDVVAGPLTAAGKQPRTTLALDNMDPAIMIGAQEVAEADDKYDKVPAIQRALAALKGLTPSMAEIKAYSGSKFDSLQGDKVPAFLKNLTKGQAAGGAAALAALLGGGAYMMNSSRKNKEREAAAAIMAAKNLSEAQRRKLLRNIGIGTGAALGGYGLYRAMR